MPVGFNHAPNPLTWRGLSLATVPCFNIYIGPLVLGKCAAFDIHRQIWQYKVKHDRRWRKLPMVLTEVKVPPVLRLEMSSA